MLYRTAVSAPVFGLRREIDRLFEDTFGRGDTSNGWTPAVDVRESEKELRLEVELPGIDPGEVELTAENGVLTIRGEKRTERKEGDEGSRYHVVERSYGSFIRSFQMPQGLDESKIEADFNNGILTIHLPKAALPQPKKIQISSRDSSRQAQVSGQAADKSVPKTMHSGNQTGRTTKGEANRTVDTSAR